MIKVFHIGDTSHSPTPTDLNNAETSTPHQIIKLNHSKHLNTFTKSATCHHALPAKASTFCNRFSTKFLLIFGMVAVTTIVICSILIAVMTARFFITSRMYDLERGLINRQNLLLLQDKDTLKQAEAHNNKTERNSFGNWMQSSFGANFFGISSESFFNKDTNFFPGCGKPTIDPLLVYTRIMNGKEAVAHSWPYAVSIAFQGPRDSVPHACGGTLINKRYILTAAHCVHKSSIYSLVGSPVRNSAKYNTVEKMMRIYVGIHDRQSDVRKEKVYGVESIKVHYRFDPETFKNDLALVRLDRDVDLSSQVGFVCVTKASSVVPGDTIYAVGWGYTETSRNQASRYLMQVDLIVQSKATCLIQYDEQDQFCAGNVKKRKDTCNGDSGGSLLKLVNNRWTLMGIVSNGDISCGGTGIYINVPHFYDWITANSQD